MDNRQQGQGQGQGQGSSGTNAGGARPNQGHFGEDKPQWEQVKVCEEGGIVITVSRRVLPHRTNYAYDIRARAMDGRAVPFFQVRTSGRGKIEVEPMASTEVLVRLKAEAEEYIRTCAQFDEDVLRDRQIARESAQLARDKPKPTVGIKSLGKRDKVVRESVTRATAPVTTAAPDEPKPAS